MGVPIKKEFFLMLNGTSLTAGRLCTPPFAWSTRLLIDMISAPECQGPVRIVNTGKGSQTSQYGMEMAEQYAPQKPTHILFEDFAINDCVPANLIPLWLATSYFNSMVQYYRVANPDVILMHQTMSSASAGDVNRTNLEAYYNNGTANAEAAGIPTLDHYALWPKPLPLADTVDMDGLHPTWAAFEQYSYPTILLWVRQMMADFWGGDGPYSLVTQGEDPLLTQSGLILEVEH